MSRFLILLTLVVFTSCSVMKNDASKSGIYKEVTDIAIKELPVFLEKIPDGEEHLYGFSSRTEMESAKLGSPFVFYKLEDGDLKKTETYRLPVIVENNYRALLTIEAVDGVLHAVDFGANVLAVELQQVCEENSEKKFEGILRAYKYNSDLAVMSMNNELYIIPLTSAKMYFQSIGISNPSRFYTQSQIINIFK